MSGNNAEAMPKWWADPDRNCVNDVRFTEIPRGRSAKQEIAELIYLCMTCPVIAECFAEAESKKDTKYPTRGVVQGGVLWGEPGRQEN